MPPLLPASIAESKEEIPAVQFAALALYAVHRRPILPCYFQLPLSLSSTLHRHHNQDHHHPPPTALPGPRAPPCPRHQHLTDQQVACV